MVNPKIKKPRSKARLIQEIYKGLAVVERAFRSLKTVDLQLRSMFHRNGNVYGRTSFCACLLIALNGTCATP